MPQSGLCGIEVWIVLQRLLNQPVQRFGTEQRPPLARDIEISNEALRFTAPRLRRRGCRGQWFRRVAGNVWSPGTLEIRSDRAATEC
jgi:hypothetical protein